MSFVCEIETEQRIQCILQKISSMSLELVCYPLISMFSNKAISRIENVNLSQKQIEEIDKLFEGPSKVGRKYIDQFVSKVERRKIKAIIGGFCCLCRSIPSKKVSYDHDGAELIEWYCDKCWLGRERILN